MPPRLRKSALLSALLLLSAPASAKVGIDWVPVGDAGNACDVQGEECLGTVDAPYRIAKFEVTNAQYAEFLNQVAATDAHELYNPNMALALLVGGITRTGSSGSFRYAPLLGREQLPVNWLSLWDAMRFANWLHNGQPSGPQNETTTEDGAYTITAMGIANNSIERNPGARVFVPNEDEWYKAAYYDTVTQTYFDYPAGSDSVTSCAVPGAVPNTANCGDVVGDLTPVGSYAASAGPNGTFDQGGNVTERTETFVPHHTPLRATRGGDYFFDNGRLAAASPGSFDPSEEREFFGFRVASAGSDLMISPTGSELQVNSVTENDQGSAAVAVYDDGDFVVAWTSQGSFYQYLKAQRFDSEGAPLGDEFKVNSVNDYYEALFPDVEIASNDDFIVAWTSINSLTGVLARRFDREGTPLAADPFLVDRGRNPFPALAPSSEGGFLAVRNEDFGGPDHIDVEGRFFDAEGEPVGGEFLVNTYTTGAQREPSVSTNGQGEFVITYTHTGYDYFSLERLPGCDIIGQAIDESGSQVGVAFQVNSFDEGCQNYSSVAVREDGTFLVVWQSEGSLGSDDSGTSIQGRLFDADHWPLTSQFQVNTTTAGDQTMVRRHDSVAATEGGGFVATWTSESSAGSDTEPDVVQARLIDAVGVPIGFEFQVNSFTSGSQRVASVGSSPSGKVVVVWQSEGSSEDDDSGLSIQAQRLTVSAPPAGVAALAALLTLFALAVRSFSRA